MLEDFDILVIGVEPGGNAATVRVARLGVRAITSANSRLKRKFSTGDDCKSKKENP